MADTVITYRVVVKEIASQHGVYASFMPRPMNGENGSGMHCHLSLAKGEQNAFFDEDDALHLSSEGRGFLAGLIRHSPEITAVTNQWVNSYKRLVPGTEAPAFSVWTGGNWGDLVRVPPYQGRAEAVRIEYRAPDSACNPYLAFSVMLAAGMKGMEEGYDLGEPVTTDLEGMSPLERAEAGISRLPSNLGQALELLRDSELVREALGDSIFDNFIRNKEIEWREFEATVTGYEVDRYLKVL
jgi:glutamine synthetase